MFDKSSAGLTLLLVLGCWSSATPGGVSAQAAADAVYESVAPAHERRRPAGDRELPTSREASQRNKADSVIKCWQYGRLILDEDNWKISDPGVPGTVLYADSDRFGRLQLMQFGDNTFCTFKHGPR